MKTGKHKKGSVTEVLGPVENLESYVKADWWRHLFNANYLRTDADVVEDQDITKDEIDVFLESLSNPPKDSAILDLCCGQGRHSFELAERGYSHVSGLDRSHYLISRARALNRRNGHYVAFKEGDARKLPYAADRFDIVFIVGNSFGYFESLKDDVLVLREVLRVLKPYGKLLLDVTEGETMRKHFQARSWEWIDKNYFVCRERSLSEDQNRLISREVITHVKKGVIADQFYAERLYAEETLNVLLKEAGFEKVRPHARIRTESKRNQDLGMMEERILLSAIAVKEWSVVTKSPEKDKTVVVLMGDPGKQDAVKPDFNFDSDDFHTIDLLKEGLSQLKGYRFVYLNRHDTLIQDLQKLKGKCGYIFNLCDEGFNNEASKELHVTALLEMLDLPYTGGTPQCLAYCYDKSLVRGIAKEMGIPVPRAFMVQPEDIGFIELPLSFPVIVKPNFGDSSFGITQKNVCFDLPALEEAILLVRDRLGYNKPILVEEYLTGKDISVGMIGNSPEAYMLLPIIQEDYSNLPPDLPRICGYEAKWDPQSPYWQIKSVPADLSEDAERFLGASCIKLFERLECRDYARFDWRLDGNGTPRLLEVNPNPGWCWDGHLAKMAKLQDLSYKDMLERILAACEDRITRSDAMQKIPARS